MDFEEKLNHLYVGKKVTADLEAMAEEETEFDWDGEWDIDEEITYGDGHMNLDYRKYREPGEEDSDEELNWDLSTGVDFTVDEMGEIEGICITARVYSNGDSGLGDCDPEDEWIEEDFKLAKKFFNKITRKRA